MHIGNQKSKHSYHLVNHLRVFMIPKNHEYIKRIKNSLESAGVDVQILKPFHWSSFENVFKILRYYKKGYNIIHVHWLYIFPLTFVMKLFTYFCKCLDIKIIWEMHNILPHGYNESDRFKAKWFYEKSDAIIFHSEEDREGSRKLLKTKCNKKHIIIPHGNFNDSYANNISKEHARRILNIPEAKKVILCFGFIRSNRGYKYLVEAARGMSNLIIIVAGRIWHKSTYKQLLEYKADNENIVLITKWIPDDEIQIFFNACDIVVLPYTDITTSGVIPLAYSFSRPVIASAIGGIKKVVNERTGILVPPRDSDSLRLAIEQIFNKDYVVMGKYAYSFAEEEFGWPSIAESIKNLYISLLAHRDS